MKPVVLAGGTGSRLWPKSRAALPKQFLSLTSKLTMLQETLGRVSTADYEKPIVICNESHRFLVAEQLRSEEFQHGGILLEPVGKNTAPAITLAALHACINGEDPILLVLAADHNIENKGTFLKAIQQAQTLAEQNLLVTLGVKPDSPKTSYGYIKQGDALKNTDFGFRVAKFVEKPDRDTAKQYLEQGDYFWNSGMFVFKASRYLQEMEKFAPDILQVCRQAITTESPDLDFIRLNEAEFSSCRSDSIDYAVMEKTDSAAMIPLDAGWSDVGSWSSLWEIASNKDVSNNVCIGDTLLKDTQNCYINAEQRLIAAVGLDNLVIVETKDAVLVAEKDKVQEISEVVKQLQQEHRPEYEYHREVLRPWGSYDKIDQGERFLVKRLKVKPKHKLSLQVHQHRTEHWVVVSGVAKVTKGEKTFLLKENESTFIPVGAVHALENPTDEPLELIEVQSGHYLDEDDIVRLSDPYGRNDASNN